MQSYFTAATLGFIQGIGTPELLIIFFVVLLLFGAKKLPELARGMGKSIKEFKKATSEIEEDIRTAIDSEPEKPKKPEHASPNVTPQAETQEEKAAEPVKEESKT